MPSKRRIIASRANGAKSRGPKTAQGRSVSSRNAITHGLTSGALILTNESHQRFDELLARYTAAFKPRSDLELEYIEQMVAARWGQLRTWTLETASLDLEMDRLEPRIQQEFEYIDEATRLAVAFRELADKTRCLDLFNRYETRYRRAYDRAFYRLRTLRAENEIFPNEPSPKNEQ